MTTISEVAGIGEIYRQKLKDAGIMTAEALLESGATPKGRQEVAEKTGISPELVLRWVNLVDLMRIIGVGKEYADLLEAAGVDTIPELAQRKAENLYQKLIETCETQKDVRMPTQEQVAAWIEEAKTLPRKISY